MTADRRSRKSLEVLVRERIAEERRRWASLGGKARRKALTPAERKTIAKAASQARMTTLTKAERSEFARRAARARWAKERAGKTRQHR